ncbi:MAG: L-ribulose-5-phosphate 4-epimerase [Firmicutes bacterium]|nr:L-ribulose-5-phosphate 4-epimerase [Bacillota bacterium]
MFTALKEEVLAANLELKNRNLIIYTWGNVSGIDRDRGLVVIKPSGVPYEDLRAEHMVVVDFSGKVVEGDLKPSSDTPTHLYLYQNFPEIGGVVHTHSPMATAWAQAEKGIPCLGTTHADYFYGEVPCTRQLTPAEIKGDYELNTGKVIVERFSKLNYLDYPGVLVASHGPFTWGKDPATAVHNSVVLEEIAKIAFHTIVLNGKVQAISQDLLDKHYLRKHGAGAYYGQATDKG